MMSSSDSDLELEQRTQPKTKLTTATKQDEVLPAQGSSPWDRMKSKQNKALKKNYLQDMINMSSKAKNPRGSDSHLVKPQTATIFYTHSVRTPPDSDNESVNSDTEELEELPAKPAGGSNTSLTPSKTKKVSFSEMVRKRSIEVLVPEDATDDEEELDQSPSEEILEDSDVKLESSGQKAVHQDGIKNNTRTVEANTKNKNPQSSQNGNTVDEGPSSPPLDAKKTSKINSGILASKKSKFTVMQQNKTSSSEESSVNSSDEEVTRKKAKIKSHLHNGALNPKKSNKNILYSKVATNPKKSLNEKLKNKNIDEEDISDSEKEQKVLQKKKLTTLNSRCSTEESSSSENSEKNINQNKSLQKSSSPKKIEKLSKTKSTKEMLSDSDVSSGNEFQNPKSPKNSPLKRKSLTKSPNTSKPISSDDDPDSYSLNKVKNSSLHRKLDGYSTSNNFEKITSKTYNLSKDLKSHNIEVYIAQIPKDLHPELLIDSSISFDKPTVLNIDGDQYSLSLNIDRNMSRVIIADGSLEDDFFNVSSIKPSGILSVCKENKVKRKSLKIHKEPEDIIEEPKNLKEQHLLLGQDYEDRIHLDQWISDKLEGLITSFNKKHKEKKLKRKSLDKSVGKEDLDIFKLLDEHTEKTLPTDGIETSYINKKKKKKRKSNQHEEEQVTEKSEMDESIDIINQLMLENEQPQEEKKSKQDKPQRSKSIYEENNPLAQDNVVVAKRKRSKSLSIKMADLEEDLVPVQEVPKKRKKSKDALEDLEKGVSLSDVPSKKSKKKGIVNSTMLSPDIDKTLLFSQEESAIAKPENDFCLNSFIDELVKGVDNVKEKKKKRKHKEMSSEEIILHEKKKKKS